MTTNAEDFLLPKVEDAECVVVKGPAQTGKTEVLVRRIAELAESGVPAEDVIVFAASRMAAQDLRSRIADATGSESFGSRVTTALDYAAGILSEAAVAEKTGRPSRVMSASEESLLMEDMRMVEGKPSRNREIIKFLLRGWSEIQDEEDKFIISSEEYLLHEGLRERLSARRGVLPHEAAALVVKCFRKYPDLAAEHAVRYVFADDCQNQCKASQLMAELLSGEQLVLAGNPDLSCEVLDPYPHAGGMAEISGKHAGSLQTIELDRSFASSRPAAAVAAFMGISDSLKEAPAAEASQDGHAGEATWTRYLTTTDEAAGISREIAALSDERRAKTGIVVPSKAWGSRMALALSKRGVAGEFRTHKGRVRWSRDAEPDLREFAIALAELALDDHDGPAWRTVFACCLPLLGCGEWRELEEFAKARGETAVDSLFKMETGVEGIYHAGLIVECRDWALAHAAEMAGLKGDALVEAVVKATGVSEKKMPRVSEDAGCEELLASMPFKAMVSAYSEGMEVRIGTPDALAGIAFDQVFVTGALDGLYPSARALDPEDTVDHRAHYRARDERAFCSALSRGRCVLRVSAPFRSELSRARKQSMGIKRIFAKNGIRWADLALSQFVPYGALDKYDPSADGMGENDD